MATPNGIRFHLIKLQADELTRIIAALKANPPPNAAELVGVIRELQDELKTALQSQSARDVRPSRVPSDAG